MEEIPAVACLSQSELRRPRSLSFEQRLEFNEGDIGVSGGIQVFEASNLNPITVASLQWSEPAPMFLPGRYSETFWWFDRSWNAMATGGG